MKVLLDRIVQDPDPDFGPDGHVSGRMAELRRKFAGKLAEMSRKGLRPPLSSASASAHALLEALPESVKELYRVADGECSSGLIVPEIEFMRAEFVLATISANRKAAAMGLLPRFVAGMLPLIRDSGGNQFLVFSTEALVPDERVYMLEMQELEIYVISRSLRTFIERLVSMHERNQQAREVRCPGDFRSLSEEEQEICASRETEVFPLVRRVGGTIYPLTDPLSWRAEWR